MNESKEYLVSFAGSKMPFASFPDEAAANAAAEKLAPLVEVEITPPGGDSASQLPSDFSDGVTEEQLLQEVAGSPLTGAEIRENGMGLLFVTPMANKPPAAHQAAGPGLVLAHIDSHFEVKGLGIVDKAMSIGDTPGPPAAVLFREKVAGLIEELNPGGAIKARIISRAEFFYINSQGGAELFARTDNGHFYGNEVSSDWYQISMPDGVQVKVVREGEEQEPAPDSSEGVTLLLTEPEWLHLQELVGAIDSELLNVIQGAVTS